MFSLQGADHGFGDWWALRKMLGAHLGVSCMARLQLGDGHAQCPSCLGEDHLKQVVADSTCVHCSYMPHAWNTGPSELPPSLAVTRGSKHYSSGSSVPPRKSKRVDTLAMKVGTLSPEMAQLKAILHHLQPDSSRHVPLHPPTQESFTPPANSQPLACVSRQAGGSTDLLGLAGSELLPKSTWPLTRRLPSFWRRAPLTLQTHQCKWRVSTPPVS